MTVRAFVVALVAALVAAAPAGASTGGSVTHTAGGVTATVQWEGDGGDSIGVVHPQLFVVRAGLRYDLTVDDICGTGCVLLADDGTTKPSESILKVADLDGDGEPEVLLDTFSGGAHCCVTTRLLTWDGTGYLPTDLDWRDEGYLLVDANEDGRPELVGHDPRFAGAFTVFAASAPPLLVYQVDHGRFVDATRRFPDVVKADAASLRKDLRREERRKSADVRGLLAAYVADLANLRRMATAKAELARQVRLKHISRRFPAHLLRQLRRWGYPVG